MIGSHYAVTICCGIKIIYYNKSFFVVSTCYPHFCTMCHNARKRHFTQLLQPMIISIAISFIRIVFILFSSLNDAFWLWSNANKGRVLPHLYADNMPLSHKLSLSLKISQNFHVAEFIYRMAS